MFKSYFQNKRVIVTGNTGFKGSWLSIWLRQLGAEVHGLSNGVPTQPSIFEDLELANEITHHHVDLRNLGDVQQVVQAVKPDVVFHLAAQALVLAAYENPLETLTTNVIGTANILEALRNAALPCSAIMITSDKCYENVEWLWGYRENDTLGGSDPYSASKACAEHVIQAYYKSYFSNAHSPVKLVSTRAGNVIGGGDWAEHRIVPDCIRAWTRHASVDVRRPAATRPWQHVLEPLSGYLQLAYCMANNSQLSGQAYNFGPSSDQNHSVNELLQEISRHWFDETPSFSPIRVAPTRRLPRQVY